MADMLAEPEDLAALLQQDLDRATATLLVETATAVVQNAAGGQRILQVVDDVQTIYLDAHDDPYWLLLPQLPATDVSAIEINGLPVTDWYPQYNRNRLYRPYGWRYGWTGGSTTRFAYAPMPVTVTYTHGFAPGDQRLQLARSAVLMLASSLYSNPTGATSEQIGDIRTMYAEITTRMEASPALMQALRKQYTRGTNSVRLINAWSGPRA